MTADADLFLLSSSVPAARPERKRAEGFVTGFQGERRLPPARREFPAMRKKSSAPRPASHSAKASVPAADAAVAQTDVRYLSLEQARPFPDQCPQDPGDGGRRCRARSQHPRQGHVAEPDRSSDRRSTAKTSTRSMPAAAVSRSCRSSPPKASSTPTIKVPCIVEQPKRRSKPR